MLEVGGTMDSTTHARRRRHRRLVAATRRLSGGDGILHPDPARPRRARARAAILRLAGRRSSVPTARSSARAPTRPSPSIPARWCAAGWRCCRRNPRSRSRCDAPAIGCSPPATPRPDGCRCRQPGGAWSLGPRGEVSEAIHLYVLAPLRTAGELLDEPRYRRFAERSRDYYLRHVDCTRFDAPNLLTHFYAYIQEALWELGCDDEVRRGMADVARHQQPNGAVPAYSDVPWVCTTGIAQLAQVWFRLGETERAERAMAFLADLQNPSGGFFGSYGVGAAYFPDQEPSWGVKYAIEAEQCRIASHFDATVGEYRPDIAEHDGRARAVLARSATVDGKRVLDAGAGKGRYAALVKRHHPDAPTSPRSTSRPRCCATCPPGIAHRAAQPPRPALPRRPLRRRPLHRGARARRPHSRGRARARRACSRPAAPSSSSTRTRRSSAPSRCRAGSAGSTRTSSRTMLSVARSRDRGGARRLRRSPAARRALHLLDGAEAAPPPPATTDPRPRGQRRPLRRRAHAIQSRRSRAEAAPPRRDPRRPRSAGARAPRPALGRAPTS